MSGMVEQRRRRVVRRRCGKWLYNRIDLEDEQAMPYEMIVVQPFTATFDPTVLGIKPIPNINDKIKAMLNKYRAETIDIEDITYEEADLEESTLFQNDKIKENG